MLAVSDPIARMGQEVALAPSERPRAWPNLDWRSDVPRIPLEERFWAKVDVRGPDDCWEWIAARQIPQGYGILGSLRGHRVSWEIHNGPIPDGLCVLHHCDNTACVNPAHLFLGTQTDNMRDMSAKGRARGKDTHCPRGHSFDEANTYMQWHRTEGRFRQSCRKCNARRQAELRERRRGDGA